MVVKIDITKVYDRLECEFLVETMKHMGFDNLWTDWIMSWVTAVRYSVLVNGTPKGYIPPTRGLRQGDTLSPYLFILCAKILSYPMTRAMRNMSLMGVRVSNNAPAVNHLLFANDSLFVLLG